MTNKYQTKKKCSEKKHAKDIKIFLKKQKKISKKAWEKYWNWTEEEKEKSVSIIVVPKCFWNVSGEKGIWEII